MNLDAVQDAPAVVTLSRAHFQRLRHYWQGGSVGSGSRTDGVDLELASRGLISRIDRGLHNVRFFITPAGEVALAAQRQAEVTNRQPHHHLAGRLAEWLRGSGRITWENIECRVDEEAIAELAPKFNVDPAQVSRHVRPDVYSMATTKNEANMNPAVHEVKVSRTDFLSDLSKPQKRLAYACFSEVFYYACPAGLIQVEELPFGAGLVVEHGTNEFEVLKRPKRQRVALSVGHMMNLLLKPGAFTPM